MSAPSLQGSLTEEFEPNAVERGVRLSTAAAAATGRAALTALAAVEAAGPVTELAASLNEFIDELSGIVHCPITTHQRELLQVALIDTIDARFAALMAQLPV